MASELISVTCWLIVCPPGADLEVPAAQLRHQDALQTDPGLQAVED